MIELGVLKAQTFFKENGKVHMRLFLLKENKELLPSKNLVKGGVFKEIIDGKEWHTFGPWYWFVNPYIITTLKNDLHPQNICILPLPNLRCLYPIQLTSIKGFSGYTTYQYKGRIASGDILQTGQKSTKGYRFGFNGQEMDNEVVGDGNTIAYELRIYDSRLGRFNSIDPRQREYPWQSTYAYFSNSPISTIDYKGGGKQDNYLIKADGSINVQKTDDKTDNFKYQDADGNITDLGTFEKNSKGLVNIKKSGISFNLSNTKVSKRYLMPEAFAAFLGASMNYYNKFGLKIQVNQFSNKAGGHSGHSKGGSGDFIDYRYTNTRGNKNEPVWTDGNNFDKGKSQFMVDQLVLFGYNSTPESLRGTRYSILTQNGQSSKKPALNNTSYYSGHYHHVHLQNYDKSHIKTVTSFDLDISGYDVIHRQSGLDNFQLPPIVIPKSLRK